MTNGQGLAIDKQKTALIVVDMQNQCLRDEGAFVKLGLDITYLKSTLEPVKRLVETCHREGIPIIFTRSVLRPDYKDAGLFAELFPTAREAGAKIAGTWNVEIVEELAPRPGDYIVDKARYSAFYNTNMEVILHGLGVDTLIVCGVTTEVCVESTLSDAFSRDYHVVLVRDAVAAVDPIRHEGALRTIEYAFGKLVSLEEVTALLVRR